MIVTDSRDEHASCAVARGEGSARGPSNEMSCATAVTATAALCLVDERGAVIAANPAGRDWLNNIGDEARLRDAVRRTLASDAAGGAATEFPHGVQFDRLDGPTGPVVVVTVRQGESPASAVLDALTHLPDRRALATRADAWRRTATSNAARFAVLFLDLDDFKIINDRHGHATGDVVLQTLAARWQHCIRDGDVLARYGGDEFVLLLQNATTTAEVEPVIRRLNAATSSPIAVGELTLNASATVGWASSLDFDGALDATIAAADRDMYARKGRVLS